EAWLSAPPAVLPLERPVWPVLPVPPLVLVGAFGLDFPPELGLGVLVGVGLGLGLGIDGVVTFGTVGIAVGVAVAIAPRSWIVLTGAGRPGIETELTGVPGGTSTVSVSCW